MEGFCLEILGDAAVKKVDKVLSSDTLTAWHIKGWVNAMENQVKTNKANKYFSLHFDNNSFMYMWFEHDGNSSVSKCGSEFQFNLGINSDDSGNGRKLIWSSCPD